MQIKSIGLTKLLCKHHVRLLPFFILYFCSLFFCYLLSVVADYSSIMRASALWSRLHSHIDATVETLLRNRFLTALLILHTNPNKKCSSLLAWHTHWKGVEAHKWNKKYEPVVSIEPAQTRIWRTHNFSIGWNVVVMNVIAHDYRVCVCLHSSDLFIFLIVAPLKHETEWKSRKNQHDVHNFA